MISHAHMGDFDLSVSQTNLFLVCIFDDGWKCHKHPPGLFPLCPQYSAHQRKRQVKTVKGKEKENWSLRVKRTDSISKRDKSNRRQGIGVVPGELSGVTARRGFDGWADRKSWLRIWELFGLPIVPGLLFALHWRFNPASSPRCHLPEHHRSQGSSMVSLKIHDKWRTCARSKVYSVMHCALYLSVWADCSTFQANPFQSHPASLSPLCTFKTDTDVIISNVLCLFMIIHDNLGKCSSWNEHEKVKCLWPTWVFRLQCKGIIWNLKLF